MAALKALRDLIVEESYILIDDQSEQYFFYIVPLSFYPLSDPYHIMIKMKSDILWANGRSRLLNLIRRIKTNGEPYKIQTYLKHDKNNKYVTIRKKINIINNYPLEFVSDFCHQSRIYIRETAKLIGSAYNHHQKVCSVVFPSSVEIIGQNAFFCCNNLKIITFKGRSRLQEIGNYAFCCTNIKKIKFPASLKKIGYSSFFECENLSSISFPENYMTKVIYDYAFGRTNIKSVVWPPGKKVIVADMWNYDRFMEKSTFDSEKFVVIFSDSFDYGIKRSDF